MYEVEDGEVRVWPSAVQCLASQEWSMMDGGVALQVGTFECGVEICGWSDKNAGHWVGGV